MIWGYLKFSSRHNKYLDKVHSEEPFDKLPLPGEKLWINQSVFTILFSNDDIILTTLLFIILKYWLLVYTRIEHSDTDLCRIYLPMYNRNGRNYSDLRDSVESSWALSRTAPSQAERCLGQNVPVPNFKIIQNTTPCSYISVTVTKIHNPECSSDVLKLSRYSLKNQQR